MMKKRFFREAVILFGLVLIFSCSQDPIFYTISTEPIPVPPRIAGGPTNMVEFKRNGVDVMYVASGDLHWYAKASWDSSEYNIPQPGGKIIGLAATVTYLYALSITDSGTSTALRRIGQNGNEWQNVPIEADSYTLIQTIFADKAGKLFAGAMNSNDSDFRILYLDDTTDPTLRLLDCDTDNTEMLSGAASLSGVHYLSTRKGVYKVDDTVTPLSAKQLPELVYTKDEAGDENITEERKVDRLFMGMLQLGDGKIIVVERNGGTFFEVIDTVPNPGLKQLKYSDDASVATGKYATGALAIWENVNNKEEKMLIAGIQGGTSSATTVTSYTHGYVEFELTKDGAFNYESARRDINPSITVDGNTDRYTATIGKHPINHFHQVSSDIDKNMLFFASTQTAGLWSYKSEGREGGPQWNAEK
jgi:hypothetical protein